MWHVELIQGEIPIKTLPFFFSRPAPPDSFITRLTQLLPALWKSNLPRASIPPFFVYQFIRGKARAERPGSALPSLSHSLHVGSMRWHPDASGCGKLAGCFSLGTNAFHWCICNTTCKRPSLRVPLYLHIRCHYGVWVEPLDLPMLFMHLWSFVDQSVWSNPLIIKFRCFNQTQKKHLWCKNLKDHWCLALRGRHLTGLFLLDEVKHL